MCPFSILSLELSKSPLGRSPKEWLQEVHVQILLSSYWLYLTVVIVLEA